MKKLLSAALAAVLTLSLAACSNAPETKEYTTEELSQILSRLFRRIPMVWRRSSPPIR